MDGKLVVEHLSWPINPSLKSSALVDQLSGKLLSKGYCLVETPTDDVAHKALDQLTKEDDFWMRPKPAYAQAYLGGGEDGNGVVASMERVLTRILARENQDIDSLPEPTLRDEYKLASRCFDLVLQMCQLLTSLTELGFRPTHESAQMLLRKQSPAAAEAQTEEESILHHLDFRRRRRICLMNCITAPRGPGFVKLTPVHEASGREPVDVTLTTGSLLLFRHDLFNYDYNPGSTQDLVLQTWILEAPRDTILPQVQGNEKDMMALMSQGFKIPKSDDPHIMAMGGLHSATHGPDEFYQYARSCCDSVIEIPLMRWDHAPYYSEDPADGLALGKHVGFLDQNEFISFDNDFWNVPLGPHNTARDKLKGLEAAYETLHQAGFTRETVKGTRIALGIGCMSVFDNDSDLFPLMLKCGTSPVGHDSFIAFHLGLTGRAFKVDTACSSSMVAMHELYSDLTMNRHGHRHHILKHGHHTKALLMGINYLFDVGTILGTTQAHMMGTSGRTSSWDVSANGFGVGENSLAAYIHNEDRDLDGKESAPNQLASVPGTACNQDGRSASLTAPNGPSQTACLRQALRVSGTAPGEVTFNECHATGTKLGDAIEFGSTRTFFGHRDTPVGFGTFKTLSGHTLVGAGATAITKMVQCMKYSMATPNNHLVSLNPNIDGHGFPHMLQSEVFDFDRSSMYVGCTGMGFGGTNARVDLMSNSRKGLRSIPPVISYPGQGAIAFLDLAPLGTKSPDINQPYVLTTCPECGGDMCSRCCLAFSTDIHYAQEHQCSHVREALAAYDCCSMCYKGRYVEGAPPVDHFINPGCNMYVVGSWSGWSNTHLMEQAVDDHGDICYFYTVALDHTGQAEFRIASDSSWDMVVYPIVKHAGPKARIAGPDSFHEGRSWLIDGSSIGMPAGSKYRIKFVWSYETRTIDWYPVEEDGK